MNYIEQIIDTSPWWHNPLWERDDRNLSAAAASGIHLRHLDDYMIKKPRVEIIRGPRQIGKTTEIKLIIKDLIKEGNDPRSIGYVICDIVSKPKELFEIVKSFSAHIALNKIPRGFLFLDEVTAVKEWQKALKTFIDMGLSKNIHIVLTGSSSIELKRGYERMPGRRSGGKDMLFLPVTLKKFCTAVDKKRSVPHEKLDTVVGSKKRFDAFKEAVYPASAFIKQCFVNYLKIGGFPRALSDFVRLGRISDETLLIYQSVLFSEFEKYRKSLATLNHICEEVISNLATPVSYNAIMRNTGISSADTVKEYIELLCRAFLGVELFCLNISTKKTFKKKDKKIFLIDPVIFSVLHESVRAPLPPESTMAENLAAIHAGRKFLSDWAYMGVLEKLYYWKSAKGNEVDFVFFTGEKPFGIEVKYQNTVSPWDEMSIRKGIGQGLLVTRDSFEYGAIPKIPMWAFLLLEME